MIGRIISQSRFRHLQPALLAGALGVVAITVLTIGLSFTSLDNYNRNVDSRAHSREVLLGSKALENTLRDAETAAWRYVFTADPAFLEQHRSAVASTEVGLAELTALAAGVKYQSARVTELQPLVPAALGHLADAIDAKLAEGDIAAALVHLSDLANRAALDRSHQILGEMIADENEHIAALTSSTDTRAQMMAFSVSSLAVVNLGLLVFLGLYMRARSHEAALRRSNEAKDQFVGLVSHELRNPIQAIMSATSILRRREDALSRADRDELIQTIGDDAARLARRVANMLLIARLEDPETNLEPLLLQRLIPRTVAIHHRRFPSRQIEIRVDEALPPVNGDASLFEQVLLNLLGNSEKYGDPAATIEVEARAEEDGVVVAVLDKGEGIDPELAEHLFEPFFRASGAKRKAEGAGLGLAVCRRLVEMQHGRIWAARRAGGGSIFAFTLPAVPGIGAACYPGAARA
ncbi:MAG: ATP-binding protein [Dehalococcoidia bacterium]|nr:ATP-binding protein [Dehalococcoidia bacterium]